MRGDQADWAVIARMRSTVRGRTAAVLLDAGQVYGRVREESRAYAPPVSSGGYLIVQDTGRAAKWR